MAAMLADEWAGPVAVYWAEMLVDAKVVTAAAEMERVSAALSADLREQVLAGGTAALWETLMAVSSEQSTVSW